MVVVGNKMDLGDERKVSFEEGMEYATKRNLSFIESSAKTRLNIDEIFYNVVRINRKFWDEKNKINKNNKNENNCIMF
jgi:GTPase SAR1 family protein